MKKFLITLGAVMGVLMCAAAIFMGLVIYAGMQFWNQPTLRTCTPEIKKKIEILLATKIPDTLHWESFHYDCFQDCSFGGTFTIPYDDLQTMFSDKQYVWLNPTTLDMENRSEAQRNYDYARSAVEIHRFTDINTCRMLIQETETEKPMSFGNLKLIAGFHEDLPPDRVRVLIEWFGKGPYREKG